MEVYHREHQEHKWLQMATWNDLNKGIEENCLLLQQNIIDWINHIGRIVKHMLPVMSDFAPYKPDTIPLSSESVHGEINQ